MKSSALSLAATWDPDLAYTWGQAAGTAEEEESKKGCCGRKKKSKRAREPPEPWVADDGTYYTRFIITSKDGTTLNLGIKEAADSSGTSQMVDLMEKLAAACLDIDTW